jgi:SAM-dependent methyltransferase
MTDWTSGYVADIGYTHGFYRELTPALLQMVAWAKGVNAPDAGKPLTYCELGCGQGFTTNLLAAANPQIEFHATDFNPSHIAGALDLARDAESANIHFYDDSFSDFVERDDLPGFDIISLHGIYSWVADEHRRTIVEFVRRKLNPGGLVYISYNALPGWSVAAPLRQLMFLHGKAQGGPTVGRITPALEFIEKLMNAEARYFTANSSLKARHEQIAGHNPSYVAHEYLNDTWSLFYHSDIAADLAGAKLSYVGSANLLDHVDPINMSAAQKEILEGISDPVLRETARDYVVNQQFRRDVFARGTVPLPSARSRETWLDSRFILNVRREDVKLKVKGALGDADLHADVYEPILDALAAGPASLRQVLAADSRIGALGWDRLIEALILLVGSNQVDPCLPARTDAKRIKAVRAFNHVVMRRACDSADLGFLASPMTGGGINVPRFNQIFLLALEQGRKTADDCAAFGWNILSEQGQMLMKDGQPLSTPEDNLAELKRLAAKFFERQLPVLRMHHIA